MQLAEDSIVSKRQTQDSNPNLPEPMAYALDHHNIEYASIFIDHNDKIVLIRDELYSI